MGEWEGGGEGSGVGRSEARVDCLIGVQVLADNGWEHLL